MFKNLISQLDEGSIYFGLKDPKSGNSLYVGNYFCAVPGSKILDKYKIKTVISLMIFEYGQKMEEGMKTLATLYSQKKKGKIQFKFS